MLVKRSRVKLARTLVVIGTGIAIAALVAAAGFPRDVLQNLDGNPAVATASALACAVGFGVAALFVGVGVRRLRLNIRTLQMTNGELVVSTWGRSESRYPLSDVERLVLISGRSSPDAWILEFADGEAFSADRECSHFDAALARLSSQLEDRTVEMSLDEYGPSRGLPPWLTSLLGRNGD